MSKLEVNAIDSVGTTLTLGDTNATTLALNSSITTLPSALKNTPAFHVKLASDQSVANATATKIQFNTEFLDTDNCWDNATNYRFTPTTAGQYFIGGLLRFQSSATASQCFFQIKKNGSSIAQSYYTNTFYNGHGIHIITNMNGSTDYIEFFAHHNFGSNTNIPTNDNTFGYGYKLIGA